MDRVYLNVPDIWFDNYLDHIEYRSVNDPYHFIDACLLLMTIYLKHKYNSLYGYLTPTVMYLQRNQINSQFEVIKKFYPAEYDYTVEIHTHYYSKLFDFLKVCWDCVGRPINQITPHLDNNGRLIGLILD